jgi:uncharacterized protein Smg (DUF494 family)
VRGDRTELLYVCVLACDLDCLKEGVSLEQAYDAVKRFNPPTFVVSSGGGLQCIWVLSEPIDVSSLELAEDHKQRQHVFFAPLIAEVGKVFDQKTLNADRMLRTPGFINHKPERNGAVAQLIHIDLNRRIDPDTLPKPPERESHRLSEPVVLPAGEYEVTPDIVKFLINGDNPKLPGANRHEHLHNLELNLANQCSACDLPYEWTLKAITEFSEKARRNDHDAREKLKDLERVIRDGYHATSEYNWRRGYFARFDSSGRLVEITDHTTPYTETWIGELPNESGFNREQIQTQIRQIITLALQEEKLRRGILIKTSPGSGKTYTLLHIAAELVRQGLIVIFATRNKDGWDEMTYKANLRSFDIDDLTIERSTFVWVGRNDTSPKSAGYCVKPNEIEIASKAGFIGRSAVCQRCDLLKICEERHYLSQIKKLRRTVDAKEGVLIICRHENLRSKELSSYADVIIIDEDCSKITNEDTRRIYTERDLAAIKEDTKLIDAFIQAKVKKEQDKQEKRLIKAGLSPDMPTSDDTWFKTLAKVAEEIDTPAARVQYRQSIRSLNALLQAIQQALTQPKPLVKGKSTPDTEISWFGGSRLFDELAKKMSNDGLKKSLEALEFLSNDELGQLTRDREATFEPKKWFMNLNILLRILASEYEAYYSRGASSWNSRIVPSYRQIEVATMEKLSINSNTLVVVADATPNINKYVRMFQTHSGYPFKLDVLNASLPQKTIYLMLEGSEHSRSTLGIREGSSLQSLPNKSVDELMKAATNLRHMFGDLTVFTHLPLSVFLETEGVKEKLGLTGINTAGYSSSKSRGSNAAKNHNIMLIGTPRINQMAIKLEAQFLYYNEPALNFDKAPVIRARKGLGDKPYEFEHGYADKRLQDLDSHRINSEMLQAAQRGRGDIAEVQKFVIQATPYPIEDVTYSYALDHRRFLKVTEIMCFIVNMHFGAVFTVAQLKKDFDLNTNGRATKDVDLAIAWLTNLGEVEECGKTSTGGRPSPTYRRLGILREIEISG